jgi:aminoglycoside phosphotransferase family enzyme/predicted kinase
VSAAAQAEAIAFLADAATHGGVAPLRIETHSAIVFLAGERAYKMKREVTYPYLDFGTVEKRQSMLAREMELNRRTAPALYLGLGAVRRVDGALRLDETGDGAGEIVEPVLVLRRFDQAALLENLADDPARLTPALLDALADEIVAFHRTAEPAIVPDAAVRFGRIIDGIHIDMREIGGPFAQDGANFAEKARARLRPLRALLDGRGAGGAVIRGHGDLHLGNIVLLEGKPTLFDGIEFNETFATVDRLYDLAFLLMDLCRRDLVPAASRILNRWLDAFADEAALGFLPLALATRAMVRASVTARRAALAETVTNRAALNEESFGLAARAMRWLGRPAPRLVAVGGLSATGKSALAATLAAALGPAPGARVLRSDVMRKSLHGLAPHETLPKAAYTKAESVRVYAAMMETARTCLAHGWPVVLDAVFAAPDERRAVAALAAETGVAFTGVFLTADRATRLARIERRAAAGRDASDADAAVALQQEAYDLGDLAPWVALDAAGSAEAVAAAARALLDKGATNG